MDMGKTLFSKLSNLFKKPDFSEEIANEEPNSEKKPLAKPSSFEIDFEETGQNLSAFKEGLNTKASLIAAHSKTQIDANAFQATHVVGFKDTLSGIAHHYYGMASEPYYRLIYEANRETIGENMNLLRAGQILKIPKLPESLNKK
ncbi:MAG: LysM peptidoglycan-binding domain-containing protein [Anaerolineaceae bacterium]|nr:LysM peptidoglycan-binding domain-containing protein [Anaerolineaceae bacterium]